MGAVTLEQKRKSLSYSIADGALYASMVGFAETYFIPLIIALGALNYQIGAFAAVPQLFLAISQFAGIFLLRRFLVRRSIIIGFSFGQAVFLAVILYGVITWKLTPWTFIAIATCYFGVFGVVIPAWNSLLGDLTSEENRGKYFGRRNSYVQLVSLFSVIAGGLILQHFETLGNVRYGFAVILLLALISRLGSVAAETKHVEIPYQEPPDSYFSFWDFIRRSRNSNFAKFVYFVGLMSFAIKMSEPYFAAYMIRDLEFSYLEYTVAQGVFIAAQFIAMRRWGSFADQFGNRAVLHITGAIMPFIPLLWFLSLNFYYILVIQVLAGLAWAGWFLGSANFIFDAVSPAKRARCAAYMNFFVSIGFALGTLFGAYLSTVAPQVLDTGAMQIRFFSPLEFIFLVSAAIRLVIVSSFIPMIREVRPVRESRSKDMFMYLTSVRPLYGARYMPFTGVNYREQMKSNARKYLDLKRIKPRIIIKRNQEGEKDAAAKKNVSNRKLDSLMLKLKKPRGNNIPPGNEIKRKPHDGPAEKMSL